MHRKVKVMQIKSYDNHIDLIGFYKENGLEFDEDFNYISSPLFSYVIQDKGEIIGAITCSKIDNNFIIEAVAVNEKYRKSGMGKKLVIRAINKMKQLDGKIIYLNSKEPLFFGKLGFKYEQGKVNFFENCLNCPEYNITCFPRVMKYQIK